MQAEFSAAITPVFSVTWPSRNHADLVCVCVCVCVVGGGGGECMEVHKSVYQMHKYNLNGKCKGSEWKPIVHSCAPIYKTVIHF